MSFRYIFRYGFPLFFVFLSILLSNYYATPLTFFHYQQYEKIIETILQFVECYLLCVSHVSCLLLCLLIHQITWSLPDSIAFVGESCMTALAMLPKIGGWSTIPLLSPVFLPPLVTIFMLVTRGNLVVRGSVLIKLVTLCLVLSSHFVFSSRQSSVARALTLHCEHQGLLGSGQSLATCPS